jgi:hypothetical protein
MMEFADAYAPVSMPDPKDGLINLPDYPAIQQLARALWRNGSVRGAAVLVGAGFSKNAERPGDDTPEPPLWYELQDGMIERLYPHDKKAAPSNPLRIAEEYRKYFGQAGLDEFIRTRFPDRAWSPGPLHAELLELPWTDVLTTNWDILLERASENTIEYSYEIVRSEADLTHARSPRIIKLHGSIGDAGPLIFAEEDYRTYPTKHAAFVNLARQVFIENELCLVGFSGDDPNFMQWAGWVRDNLGGSARRIYLVGNLRLEHATRKYLEAHNIAPIDLSPLVKDLARKDQHAAATRIFLDEMRKAKPVPANEWRRTPWSAFPMHAAGPDIYQRVGKDHALAAELLEKTIPLLTADRKNYPGWLVCPVRHRSSLPRAGDMHWLLRKPVLDLLNARLRAEAAFEALWCRKTALLPLDAPLIETMKEILEASSPEADQSLRLEFALALMRQARVSHDDDGLRRWAALIDAEAQADAPERQDAEYQLCLRARDRMDLEGVTAGLARLTSEDPIWKLRRAALHTEIGEYVKATKLIKDATGDLERRHRLDRNSLSIKSKLAWANWISRASEAGDFVSAPTHARPRDFKGLEIDPLGEIEHIEDAAKEIEKDRRENAGVQPSFDAGYYRDGSGSIRIGGGDPVGLLYEFDQLTEFVGMPIRINHVNICAEAALAALDVGYQPTAEWYVGLLRVVHAHLDVPFKRYFGRIAIAKLQADVAAAVISTLEGAIAFWTTRFKDARAPDLRDDHRRALDVLRLLLVALSRLTVRMSEERAMPVFKLAIDLAKDPLIRHEWLLEALGDLAKYAAEVISVARQGALALDVIEFPLASEKGAHHRFWPKVVTAIWNSTPNRDLGDPRWSNRVLQLIAAEEKGQPAREEATLRLVYLAIRDALSPEEAAAFGSALWSDLDEDTNALPVNTGILPSSFAQLPAGDGIDAQARVRERLFEPDLRQVMLLQLPISSDSIQNKQRHLISLINVRSVGMTLPADIAARMFDQVVVWEPNELDHKDPFAMSLIGNFNNGMRSSSGELLTVVVVPSMRAEDRTEQRAQALLAFVRRAQSWRGLGALPYFVASAPSETDDILSVIRTGLVGSEFSQVGSAAMAIAVWAKLVCDGVLQEILWPLVDQLIATIETRQEAGLHAMLDAALSLLKEGVLTKEDLNRLMKALEKIRLEFRYETVDFDSKGAVSISLVRAECVKLAAALKDCVADDGTLEAWIDEAKSDPLPEVRLSLANF